MGSSSSSNNPSLQYILNYALDRGLDKIYDKIGCNEFQKQLLENVVDPDLIGQIYQYDKVKYGETAHVGVFYFLTLCGFNHSFLKFSDSTKKSPSIYCEIQAYKGKDILGQKIDGVGTYTYKRTKLPKNEKIMNEKEFQGQVKLDQILELTKRYQENNKIYDLLNKNCKHFCYYLIRELHLQKKEN